MPRPDRQTGHGAQEVQVKNLVQGLGLRVQGFGFRV